MRNFVEDKDLALYYQHLADAYLLAQTNTYRCCLTPDCNNKFLYESDNGNSRFDCEICHKSYCLDCKVEYHSGETCQEYQARTNKIGRAHV